MNAPMPPPEGMPATEPTTAQAGRIARGLAAIDRLERLERLVRELGRRLEADDLEGAAEVAKALDAELPRRPIDDASAQILSTLRGEVRRALAHACSVERALRSEQQDARRARAAAHAYLTSGG